MGAAQEEAPGVCTIVSPAEAKVKQMVMLEVLKGLERDHAHLRFGRALGEPFIQRIRRLFLNSLK